MREIVGYLQMIDYPCRLSPSIALRLIGIWPAYDRLDDAIASCRSSISYLLL